MDIYILRDGKEIGPFSEETTHQMLKQGVVLINDSAWRPGMPEWIPLHDVLYPAPAAVSSESPESFAAVQIAPEPASAKQKAFLDYMGTEAPAGISKEQAAILVNDAMEDPKNSARVARWNDERLKLHPDLFAAELQAKKEGRAQRYFELCQTEGADVLEGITKAHCQVLVGYLDVKAPNWDANETEGLWNYFFPAISEKFPALVREDWKGRLQYPQGPKVSADLKRRAPVTASSSHKRKGPSPIASLFKGLVLGLLILTLGVGGFYVYQHPEVIDQAKVKLASLQKPGNRTSKTMQAKPVSTPAPVSTPDSQPLFSGSPLAGTSTTPPVATAASGDSAPTASSSPMGSSPSMAGANSHDAGMNSAPPMPESGPTPSGSNTVSLFDPPPSSASTSSAGSTMENNTAAAGGLPGPKTTVVITQPLEVQLTYGKIQIPVGTQLRIIEQEGATLKVRFQNQTVSIPASATDLGGVATPQ